MLIEFEDRVPSSKPIEYIFLLGVYWAKDWLPKRKRFHDGHTHNYIQRDKLLGEGVISSSIVIRKRLSKDLRLYWTFTTNHTAQIHKVKLKEDTCVVDQKVFGCLILSGGGPYPFWQIIHPSLCPHHQASKWSLTRDIQWILCHLPQVIKSIGLCTPSYWA